MSNCLLIILVIGSSVIFGGFPSRFLKCCSHSFTLSCWLAVFNFALAVLFLLLTSFIVCQAILDFLSSTKLDGQPELTYSSYVRTQDVTLKTCQRRWMIGRSGERGSGISVLAARHDDIYIYIYISSSSCRAASTDIPDPLSPLLPIAHRLWSVFRAKSYILT